MSKNERWSDPKKVVEEERKNRIVLSKEEAEAVTPEEMKEAKIRGAILGFCEAILEDKPKDAYLCIGVLASNDVPDLPYYYGTVKQYEKDYAGALEEYKKIGKESEKYGLVEERIKVIYVQTGNYEELSKMLAVDTQESDIVKFEKRTMCIMYAQDRSIQDLTSLIAKYPFEVITGMKPDDKEEAVVHTKVCNMICNCLVAAGTCINRVGIYVKRMNGKQIDFDNDLNVKKIIASYERIIMMLKALNAYKAVKIMGQEDEIITFDRIALASKDWTEKDEILQTDGYQKNLIHLIVQLLNPQRFPAADRFVLVVHLLDLIQEIGTVNSFAQIAP